MRLTELGWDETFAAAFLDVVAGFSRTAQEAIAPARVAIEFNHNYRVLTEAGEQEVMASGRLKHRAASRAEMPAVGDWVAVRTRGDEARGAIVAVLPRRSKFSRKMAGQVTDEQIVAANVDVSFVVMALDADFSVRRLERYLLLIHDSGATPVILLTKPDLASDLAAQVADVTALAGTVPVHVVNPKRSEGIDLVAAYLTAGRTGALLGSSGVGKSTIINRLAGEDVQKTREVREGDSKGRHTTTHRELVLVPGGGLIIDTPGMRELQLWDASEAVRETFDDIEALGTHCHFTDCRHRDEPRCAVKAAVQDGRLAADRLESYLKLQEELTVLAQQQDERALLERKRQGKVGAKALRLRIKDKRG
jgi:ribosome biogenesis GTPase